MPQYLTRGTVPPKRHTQSPRPGGGFYYEELMGENGFSAASALLYHERIPSALVDARPWTLPDQSVVANSPLLPRHLRPHELFSEVDLPDLDVVTGRRVLLGNADVRISYAAGQATSPLYRNAVGDECGYVESGAAVLRTSFGPLSVTEGDYVVIPCGTIHQWAPDPGAGPLRLYCLEASSHLGPARRYLSQEGQLLEHAPYCERDIHGPGEPEVVEADDVEVYVKHRALGAGEVAGTIHVMEHHPFDVVGWDGQLYPYSLSIHDFEPLTGRVHQPPPMHQVFEGGGFVVCNFVPRKVDYHPLAVPVPYYHANVDSDEVMFYCAGDYSARKGSGIGVGSISLHPAGHTHGPAPGAYLGSVGIEEVDELAVMVDTFRPLGLGEGARVSEDPGYAWTWSERPGS